MPVNPGATVTTPATWTRAPGVAARAAAIEIGSGSDALGDGEARRGGEGDAVGPVVGATLEVEERVGSEVGAGDVGPGAVGLGVVVGWGVAAGWGVVRSGPVGPSVGVPLGLPVAAVTDPAALIVGVAVAPLVGRDASD